MIAKPLVDSSESSVIGSRMPTGSSPLSSELDVCVCVGGAPTVRQFLSLQNSFAGNGWRRGAAFC